MFYLIALKYERAVNVSREGLHGLVRALGPAPPECVGYAPPRPGAGPRPQAAHRPGRPA